MPTRWQIECLTSRLNSLNTEINRVAEKDHPYSDPDTVYEGLKGVIKSRLALLRDAEENYEFGDPDSERALRETVNTIAESAEEIAEVFSYAYRVDSARIPFEILRSLSWVASSLLNEDCHAVVRLDPDYNYTILSCRREFEEKLWGQEWSEAVAKTRTQRAELEKGVVVESADERPYTVLLLGFPSYDANSILLHALAAHELGHEIFFRNKERVWEILGEAVRTATQKDHPLHMQLQEYARENIRVPTGSGLTDDYDKSVNQIRAILLEFLHEQWIVEVFSDLYAANLIGPTFIAAFDKIELKPNRVDRSHPSGRLRRELVRGYLAQYLSHVIRDPVWGNLFEIRLPDARPVSGIAEDDDPLAPLYSIGEEICRICLPQLAELISSMPSPLKDEAKLQLLLKNTREHFANLAPPSVPLQITGTDIDVDNFWLLMYAGWHFRFNEPAFKEFAEKYGWAGAEASAEEIRTRAEDVLGNLLLHALESIEIRFLWQRDRLERIVT
jgi:hypothetical protein